MHRRSDVVVWVRAIKHERNQPRPPRPRITDVQVTNHSNAATVPDLLLPPPWSDAQRLVVGVQFRFEVAGDDSCDKEPTFFPQDAFKDSRAVAFRQ